MVKKAYDIGLAGICITDHESLGASIEIDKLQKEYEQIDPNFKIVHGNEIYLTDTRDSGQYYYHFILIALDEIGFRMLKELSSQAWINSYFDRGMERVPTLKSEVEAIIEKYGQNHLHASSACLAGEVNHNLSEMIEAEIIGDLNKVNKCHNNIVNFILWCQNIFGKDNFTLEIAPGRGEEQLAVNKRMLSVARAFDCKICIGTDAHYLSPEDRYVHKAFLNSKEGEREVDSFYSYSYLQTEDEIIQNLADTGLDYEWLCQNSMEIYDKVKPYSLFHKQQVPQVEVPIYPIAEKEHHFFDIDKYPILDKLMHSENPQERYWINYCINALKEKRLWNEVYLTRLEEEADIMDTIGKELETCIFSYPIFLQHYIDMFWEIGSTVGTGRGSAGAGLNHWLLGITALDPIKDSLPYWRFLNKERFELPKITISYWAVVKKECEPCQGVCGETTLTVSAK